MSIDRPLPRGKHGHMLRGVDDIPVIGLTWPTLAVTALIGTVLWLALIELVKVWL